MYPIPAGGGNYPQQQPGYYPPPSGPANYYPPPQQPGQYYGPPQTGYFPPPQQPGFNQYGPPQQQPGYYPPQQGYGAPQNFYPQSVPNNPYIDNKGPQQGSAIVSYLH